MTPKQIQTDLATLAEKISVRKIAIELYNRKTPLSHGLLYNIVRNLVPVSEKSQYVLEPYLEEKRKEGVI